MTQFKGPTKTQRLQSNDIKPMTLGRFRANTASLPDDTIIATEEIDDIRFVITDVAIEEDGYINKPTLRLLCVSEYAACIEDALTL